MKMPVSASITHFSPRRYERNQREASQYASMGYKVERNMHPNGAFFANIGGRDADKAHEITIGRILAENGISTTIDAEGNMKVRLPDGRLVTLPSLDGTIGSSLKDGTRFTHEIAALRGKTSASKVADAIEHSFKPSKDGSHKQADVALTIATIGSDFHRKDIDDGVREHIRRVEAGETKARPLIYLHIDEANRKVYYRDTKAYKTKK